MKEKMNKQIVTLCMSLVGFRYPLTTQWFCSAFEESLPSKTHCFACKNTNEQLLTVHQPHVSKNKSHLQKMFLCDLCLTYVMDNNTLSLVPECDYFWEFVHYLHFPSFDVTTETTSNSTNLFVFHIPWTIRKKRKYRIPEHVVSLNILDDNVIKWFSFPWVKVIGESVEDAYDHCNRCTGISNGALRCLLEDTVNTLWSIKQGTYFEWCPKDIIRIIARHFLEKSVTKTAPRI